MTGDFGTHRVFSGSEPQTITSSCLPLLKQHDSYFVRLARSILVSLWSADDSLSRIFYTIYYEFQTFNEAWLKSVNKLFLTAINSWFLHCFIKIETLTLAYNESYRKNILKIYCVKQCKVFFKNFFTIKLFNFKIPKHKHTQSQVLKYFYYLKHTFQIFLLL